MQHPAVWCGLKAGRLLGADLQQGLGRRAGRLTCAPLRPSLHPPRCPCRHVRRTKNASWWLGGIENATPLACLARSRA
jgi:hypothetical protein